MVCHTTDIDSIKPSGGHFFDGQHAKPPKNIMLVGGLLQIVYFGAGPMSIDASRDQRLPGH